MFDYASLYEFLKMERSLNVHYNNWFNRKNPWERSGKSRTPGPVNGRKKLNLVVFPHATKKLPKSVKTINNSLWYQVVKERNDKQC